MKKKYFLWADIIRILAIFLVVAVHLSYLPQNISIDNFFYYVHFAIAKTSVPLFVMLSGALLLTKAESSKDFYTKRLRRILFPWIFWSIIYIFFLGFPVSFSGLKAAMVSFWFMPMITGLYVLTPIMRKMTLNSKWYDLLVIVVLWFVSVSLLPYYHQSQAFPFSADSGIVRQVISFVGYYLLGFYIIKFIPGTKRTIIIASIFTILGLLASLLSFAFKGGTQEYLYFFDYGSPGIVLFSIGLFMLISSLSNSLIQKIAPYRAIISSISAASFGIYFVHLIIWKYMQELVLMKNNPVQNMLVSLIVVFAISYFVIAMGRKIPLLRNIIS